MFIWYVLDFDKAERRRVEVQASTAAIHPQGNFLFSSLFSPILLIFSFSHPHLQSISLLVICHLFILLPFSYSTYLIFLPSSSSTFFLIFSLLHSPSLSVYPLILLFLFFPPPSSFSRLSLPILHLFLLFNLHLLIFLPSSSSISSWSFIILPFFFLPSFSVSLFCCHSCPLSISPLLFLLFLFLFLFLTLLLLHL